MLKGASVSMQRFELLRERKLTRAGWGFAAVALPFAMLVGRGTWTQVRADRERTEHRRDSAEARAAYDRGVADAQDGKLEEAIACFESAIRLAPDFQAARENLAGMYCASGRYREGIAEYEAALRLSPLDPETHFLLGRACAESGDMGSAERHWNDVVRIDPGHANAHEQLALLCEARGDFEGARVHRRAAALPAPPRSH
jgi:tetratricopeptide (TPR) repeat protein